MATSLRADSAAIEAARRALGLDITALAEQAGLHRSTVSNIANGRRAAGSKAARAISKALRKPVRVLFPTTPAR